MNDKPVLPSTTDEPLLAESIREDRFAAAAAALHRARSRGDHGEIQAVLERYSDLAEELRNLLELEAFFGLHRPWADPLGLLEGAPLSLKYDVLEEASHGAFGRVLKARDRVLGRFVAIKVLQARHADTSALNRFIEEPQVAGQLDHPGVVPVHELGKTPDGLPYIVMKWVDGPTLHDLLHGERSPDDLPRFLELFKQVCRTVACAHRKGVLHRDLKPANIMIGADGEALVMDWGLSKVLQGPDDEPGADAPAAIETVRSLNPALATVAGARMGTVAYMPPEQAQGRGADVTERSDVFALGAILCEALTGRSPYWTAKLVELESSPLKTDDPDRYKREMEAARMALVERAHKADLGEAFARLDACNADPELKRLAKDCLAVAPEHRPADAGAVAGAVSKYLDGLFAEKASLRSRLLAVWWRLAAAGAVALFVAAALVVGLWYKFDQDARRLQLQKDQEAAAVRAEARDDDARGGLELVDAALRAGKWDEAKQVLQRVKGRLEESGPPELRERVLAAQKDLEFIDQWESLREQRSHIIYGKALGDHAVAVFYSYAFQELGIDLHSDSVAQQIKESPIREQLMAALDHWVMVEEASESRVDVPRLLAVARAASISDWGEAFHDPKIRGDPAALAQLAANMPVSSAGEVESMAWLLLYKGDVEPLLRRALELHADDIWLNLLMAQALERKAQAAPEGEPRRRIQERAVEHCRIAVAVQPESTSARTLLGELLTDCGRYDEAVEELKRPLQAVEKPPEPEEAIKRSFQAPDLMSTRYALARALLLRGERDDLQQAETIGNELSPPLWAQFQELQKQIRERRNRP